LVGDVGVHPFSPIEMQKDALRLERFYNRNGFLHPEVDWLVRLDSAKNVVNILFTIEEGPPLILQNLDFRGPDGRAAFYQFPADVREDWVDFRDDIALQTGQRLDDFALLQLQDRALGWVRDQGYAFATVEAESAVDSLAHTADVTIRLDAGPRSRVEAIRVEWTEPPASVSPRVVRREVPLRRGEWFSYTDMVEGQRQVFGLNLFQIALADVPEDQAADSTVDVRVRVREAPPRVITAAGGYLTESGLRTQAQWTHRNFTGGARTLTLSALAETGLLAISSDPSRRYRADVAFREPYFFNRNLAGVLSPFAEFRDDLRDRSWRAGTDATVIWERDQLETASLRYSFLTRRVFEYRADALAGGILGIRLVQLEDSLGTQLQRSTLSLSGTYGSVDDPLDPRAGFIVRPAADVTLPVLTSVEFVRLGGSAVGYVPFTDAIGLYGRVSGGRLLPFGQSVPAGGENDPLLEFLRLRDVAYFGGGTTDVRGWGNGTLGPKLPDIEVEDVEVEDEDTGAVVDTVQVFNPQRRYVPLGGFAKVAATAELRLPFPFFGPSWGTFVFFDAGRVWTPDGRYDVLGLLLPDDEEGTPRPVDVDEERFFYSTGAGISFATPVGALRFSVGYKLNPSEQDLLDASDVALATYDQLFPGQEPALEEDPWRRIHLHLSIGQTF
ncbi:MAG: BamA/TamA family outer membrane protein, partial [Rhodothermales bacterium]|nr:BamA/TamA family outer membrane protein [Rhodothermales bacterium]